MVFFLPQKKTPRRFQMCRACASSAGRKSQEPSLSYGNPSEMEVFQLGNGDLMVIYGDLTIINDDLMGSNSGLIGFDGW